MSRLNKGKLAGKEELKKHVLKSQITIGRSCNKIQICGLLIFKTQTIRLSQAYSETTK